MNDTRERDRRFAEIAVVGEDLFSRGWYVAEPMGRFYLTRSGEWTFNVSDFWPTEEEAKAALEAVRAKYPPSPAWHDKPTCPGMWVLLDKTGKHDPFVAVYPATGLDSRLWLLDNLRHDFVFYGPIPPRETGEAT